ncbi:MAG: hypothetical protein ACFB0D_01765 [Phormidesmis sp.]
MKNVLSGFQAQTMLALIAFVLIVVPNPTQRLQSLQLRLHNYVFASVTCQEIRYQPGPKPERKNYWGSQLLAGLKLKHKPTKKKRPSPGQINLWEDWQPCIDEVHKIAKTFVLANCLNPDFSAEKFLDTT